jgi:hypothetical protein
MTRTVTSRHVDCGTGAGPDVLDGAEVVATGDVLGGTVRVAVRVRVGVGVALGWCRRVGRSLVRGDDGDGEAGRERLCDGGGAVVDGPPSCAAVQAASATVRDPASTTADARAHRRRAGLTGRSADRSSTAGC